MDLKSKIILVSGPTSSGKSNFAVKLARKINGEIINADSMQVYKELNILTARPKENEYKKIRHHLYGFLSVKKNFSAGAWLKLTLQKIKEIKKRKKIPILVGGTGLYFKALIEGLVKIPNIPNKFRNKIRKYHKNIGQKKFFTKLTKIDPLIKDKIKLTDVQRSLRAYEVKLFTKKSIFEWFKNTKSKYPKDEFIKIYIDYPRAELVEKISERTSKMVKSGAINEVKNFLKLNIRNDKTSTKVIGINEIRDFIDKKSNLSELTEKISIKTRQYAKRQATWARGQMSDWQKIKPKDIVKILKKI